MLAQQAVIAIGNIAENEDAGTKIVSSGATPG
jgi:hypothetical protein